MFISERIRLAGLLCIGAALSLFQSPAWGDPVIIVTSAEIHGYFGTATLLSPGGATLFSQNYLFLTTPISPDLAFDITADAYSDADAFPIFQNNVGQFATLDSNVFVREISNGNCYPGTPFCDPNQALPILAADANLANALHMFPVSPGNTAVKLTDTGDVSKGSVQYVVFGFEPDGTTVISASINIDLFEHDLTAVAEPNAAAPEPATWLLMLAGVAVPLIGSKLRGRV
jgi:hypothetical protein